MDREQIIKLIREKAQQAGINPDYLIWKAQTESNLDPEASKGSHVGLYQFSELTGKEMGIYDKEKGIDKRKDVEASIDATIKYMQQNERALKSYGIENPTEFDLYMAHQQGAKGWSEIKKNENLSTDRLKNIRGNMPEYKGDINTASGKEFMEYWEEKFTSGMKTINADYTYEQSTENKDIEGAINEQINKNDTNVPPDTKVSPEGLKTHEMEKEDLSDKIEGEKPLVDPWVNQEQTEIEKQFEESKTIKPFGEIPTTELNKDVVPSDDATKIEGQKESNPIYDFIKRDFSNKNIEQPTIEKTEEQLAIDEIENTNIPENQSNTTNPESDLFKEIYDRDKAISDKAKKMSDVKTIFDTAATTGSLISNMLSKGPKGVTPTLTYAPSIPTSRFRDQSTLDRMLAGSFAGGRQMSEETGRGDIVTGITGNLMDAEAKGMDDIGRKELERQAQQASINAQVNSQNAQIQNQAEIYNTEQKAKAAAGLSEANAQLLSNYSNIMSDYIKTNIDIESQDSYAKTLYTLLEKKLITPEEYAKTIYSPTSFGKIKKGTEETGN